MNYLLKDIFKREKMFPYMNFFMNSGKIFKFIYIYTYVCVCVCVCVWSLYIK